LNGPPAEGEESDAESRKAGAIKHLQSAVKTGAVEPSDLDKIQDVFKPLGSEEWKKIVDSAAEKRKELKEEAKRGGILGVMLDHGSGWVTVTGTYAKSGARLAGLAPDDILLEVDGRRVNHIGDVSSILTGRDAGASIAVKVQRELRPKLKLVEVRTVTLTARPTFEE
jgi:predicted metalloprotease with PDZ domain